MLQVIILAAGHGKRMNSDIPKPLIEVGGKPIIQHLLDSIKISGICEKPIAVIGQKAELVKEKLGDQVEYVVQEEQLGTGHAVAVCKEKLKDTDEDILVLYGDHPLLKADSLKKLADLHQKEQSTITLMTNTVKNFDDWREPFIQFGRIIRTDNQIREIVEKKDCTPEQLEIKEVNPGYYCFNQNWLWQNIDKLKNENAQGEYYLTDLVKMAIDQNQKVLSSNIEPKEALGVNTAEQLEIVKKLV
ncbi:NTP transferase domain-containing protein [Patescibacteria group bacterium]|nr:NTP transferase domain-containing protein [Patescibacteria group bacterium]